MRFIFLLPVLASALIGEDGRLFGFDLLNGIREIIGSDPNLPRNEVDYKPFVGSFSTIKSVQDRELNDTSYCMTDNHCGHFEAYSDPHVPLYLLNCNKFCYIDGDTRKYKPSDVYTVDNPPESYLNCGWETCN